MNASTIISNFKSQISEIIKEQTLTTLARLRSKIFKAVDVEDDFEIDMNKFAENTLNKIMEESSSLFSDIEEGIKKATEKVPKLKKDPDAPKAAVNAYILFSRDNRSDIKSENPEMKATDITKKLAEMWKESDEDLKQEYKEKAEQDKERYAKELESYVPKEGFQNPKEKKGKTKKVKIGPSKPLNAYMWFCKEKREELKGKGFDNTEILREMGRLWKELSEKKKKPYVSKAEDDKERYEEEMKNYVPTEEEKAALLLKNESKSKGKGKGTNGPKRPLGAFMLFRKDNYQTVKEENPNMKMGDIMKEIGEMWKGLSQKEKKKYTDQAAKLLAEFKNKNSGDKEENSDDNDDEKEEIVNSDSDEAESDEDILNEDDKPSKKSKKDDKKAKKDDKKEKKPKKYNKKAKKDESESEQEEDEELDLPSTNTPTKCMPNIVSDAKFAKMKEEEERKKKEEKKKEKKEKKAKKTSKKSKKSDSDDEEILSDDE